MRRGEGAMGGRFGRMVWCHCPPTGWPGGAAVAVLAAQRPFGYLVLSGQLSRQEGQLPANVVRHVSLAGSPLVFM